MLQVLPSAFDSLPATNKQSRHLFIDTEQTGAAWSIVLRGEDMHIIGRTNRPELAELIYNDVAGAYAVFTLAECDDEIEANAAAASLRQFFSSPRPLSDRLESFPTDYLLALALVLSRFDAMTFTRRGPGACRCESFYASTRRVRLSSLEGVTL